VPDYRLPNIIMAFYVMCNSFQRRLPLERIAHTLEKDNMLKYIRTGSIQKILRYNQIIGRIQFSRPKFF
jgi:hypothetical protein